MFGLMEKALFFMIALRLISGSIEITAAMLMFKFNDLEKAFYINTMLALVGPVILIVTTGIGLSGLSEKISLRKGILLFSGIVLIIMSLKSKYERLKNVDSDAFSFLFADLKDSFIRKRTIHR